MTHSDERPQLTSEASTFERAQNEKDSYRFELVGMCYKGSGMGIWQA